MAGKGIVINISGSGEGAAEALRQIEAKMQETATKGNEMGEQLAAAGEKIQAAFGAVGIGLGVGEVISKMKEMVSSSIELGVEIGHLSQQTGISTQNLSVLKYAASQTGVEFDTLTKGFKKLSTEVYDADTGSTKAQKSFAALGITSADLKAKGNDLYGVLAMVADKFKDMPDGITKNALATELFGRAGQALIPILNEGAAGIEEYRSKAQALGIVLDAAGAKKMEELHKSLDNVKTAFEGVGLSITSALEPALVWLANYISNNFGAGMHTLDDWADNAVHAIGRVAYAAVRGPLLYTADFDSLFPGKGNGMPPLSMDYLQSKGNFQRPPQPAPIVSAGGSGSGGTSGALTVNTFDLYNKTIEENTRNVEANRAQSEQIVAAGEAAAKQMQADALAGELEVLKAFKPPNVTLAGPDAFARFAANPAGKEKQDDKLNEEAARAATQSIGGFMDQLSEQAIRGKLSFKSLADSAIMDLERFAMKVMEERTLLPMLNSLFGVGGAPGGIDSSINIGGASNTLAGLSMPAFAKGGDIDSGWAVVGDGGDGSGSELFAPKGPGTVLPHDVLEGLAASRGGGGGAPNVTVNNINNSSSQVQMKQAGVSWDGQARQFIIHTVLEDMQQGGPMSAAMQGFAPK